ncbi:MAG: GIY-YIG nuclease family protein [Aerococcaceae bacterium]|nr:GIY-YIG nuclease family protein [Aerococcaceae bacterium]
MGTNAYYFYVLHCQDGTLYAGYTTDLEKRLATHNAGKGAKYTQIASRRPLRLLYAERWATKSQAMRAEALFKRLSRPAKEAYLWREGQQTPESNHFVLVNRIEEEI